MKTWKVGQKVEINNSFGTVIALDMPSDDGNIGHLVAMVDGTLVFVAAN